MKLLIIQSSPASILLSALLSNALNLCSSLSIRAQGFHSECQVSDEYELKSLDLPRFPLPPEKKIHIHLLKYFLYKKPVNKYVQLTITVR